MPQARRGRKEAELHLLLPAIIQQGESLRRWRRYRGLTVTELAIQAGFGRSGRSYISKIEHGAIQHVGEAHLMAILQALEIRHEDFLTSPPQTVPEVQAPDPVVFGQRISAWDVTTQARSTSHRRWLPQESVESGPQKRGDIFGALDAHGVEATAGPVSSASGLVDTMLRELEYYGQMYLQQFLQERLRPLLQALVEDAMAKSPSSSAFDDTKALLFNRDEQPHSDQDIDKHPASSS